MCSACDEFREFVREEKRLPFRMIFIPRSLERQRTRTVPSSTNMGKVLSPTPPLTTMGPFPAYADCSDSQTGRLCTYSGLHNYFCTREMTVNGEKIAPNDSTAKWLPSQIMDAGNESRYTINRTI